MLGAARALRRIADLSRAAEGMVGLMILAAGLSSMQSVSPLLLPL